MDQSEAEASLAYAEGKYVVAQNKFLYAATREESEDSDPTAQPAREMLADMFLELKRPAQALKEYQVVLKNFPNRFDAVYGAARAAQSAGEADQARSYFAQLTKICPPGADRPELQEAQTQLAKK